MPLNPLAPTPRLAPGSNYIIKSTKYSHALITNLKCLEVFCPVFHVYAHLVFGICLCLLLSMQGHGSSWGLSHCLRVSYGCHEISKSTSLDCNKICGDGVVRKDCGNCLAIPML